MLSKTNGGSRLQNMQKRLRNPAVLRVVRINGQVRFEGQPSLLSSKIVDRQHLTCQEPRYLQREPFP